MIRTITLTGTAATVPISADGKLQAQWIDVFVPTANSATVQIGDGTVSSTVGRPIAKTTSFTLPPVHRGGYALNTTYLYIAMDDKAIVTYEDFD